MSRLIFFPFTWYLLLCVGCASYAFKPPPPLYLYWYPHDMSSADATDRRNAFWDGAYKGKEVNSLNLEVQKAMLECGYPDTWGGGDRIVGKLGDNLNILNSYAISELCMVKSGYQYLDTINTRCDIENLKTILPACQLDVNEVPSRDVSKRINSKFCKNKTYSSYEVCQ